MSRPGDPIERPPPAITRRRLLRLAATASAVGYLGSRDALDAAASALIGDASPSAATDPGSSAVSGTRRVLYRGANLANGRSSQLQRNVSVFVDGGRIGWIRPRDSEEDPGPADGLELVNAAGLTIVPGMVDAHCHLTSPGGVNWLDYFQDSPSTMLHKPSATAGWRAIYAQSGVRGSRRTGSVAMASGRSKVICVELERYGGQLR